MIFVIFVINSSKKLYVSFFIYVLLNDWKKQYSSIVTLRLKYQFFLKAQNNIIKKKITAITSHWRICTHLSCVPLLNLYVTIEQCNIFAHSAENVVHGISWSLHRPMCVLVSIASVSGLRDASNEREHRQSSEVVTNSHSQTAEWIRPVRLRVRSALFPLSSVYDRSSNERRALTLLRIRRSSKMRSFRRSYWINHLLERW